MPEYLSPGVYVEEIDTGSQPIAGVSTSTAGMVGVTARGPVNIPILLTNSGDYSRWFGGLLDLETFGANAYLPYAADGFFTNGGTRLYVVRVQAPGANAATLDLFDRAEDSLPPPKSSALLRAAPIGSGGAGNALLVLDGEDMAANDSLRIGDGSNAEWHGLFAVAAAANLEMLSFPLTQPYAIAPNMLLTYADAPDATLNGAHALEAWAASGDLLLEVASTVDDLRKLDPVKNLLDLRRGGSRELVRITGAQLLAPGLYRVNLARPLNAGHPAGTEIVVLDADPSAPASQAAPTAAIAAGDQVLAVAAASPPGTIVEVLAPVGPSGVRGPSEVRRVSDPGRIGLIESAARMYPRGSVVESMVFADSATTLHLTADAPAGTRSIAVDNRQGLMPGAILRFGATGSVGVEYVTIAAVPGIANPPAIGPGLVALEHGLRHDRASGLLLARQAMPTDIAVPTAGLAVGMTVSGTNVLPGTTIAAILDAHTLSLSDPPSGGVVAAGEVLTFGAPIQITTATASGTTVSVPTAGLAAGMSAAGTNIPAGTTIQSILDASHLVLSNAITAPGLTVGETVTFSTTGTTTAASTPAPTARSGLLMLDVETGDRALITSEVDGYAPAAATIVAVRITTPDNTPYLLLIDKTTVAISTLRTVQLNAVLERNQPAGATVARRTKLLQVQALDTGIWGNRLMIAIEDETTGLVSGAAATGTIAANRIILSSLSGVEPGTILELRRSDGSRIGGLIKVDAINRNDTSATLDAPLDADQLAAVSAPGARVPVFSREFRMTVMLRRPDDPAVPSRGTLLQNTEVFRNLSMDPRHSRYVATVIGQIGGPLRISDRRPEGQSNYVRVLDYAAPPVPVNPDPRWVIRLGPEALYDVLPSGTTQAARAPLENGDDGLATLSDADYVGVDDREPVNRTGIFALKNVDEISIVAAPGMVSDTIQQALIDHCELLLYRFAVLDGPPPPDDAIADVQALRQNYDTKYAALYYPWLTIPDPLPANLSAIAQVPIPPAGHVMGVYARIDDERGVHKAPANEIVRGITGLTRTLNKAENDILNPFPSNTNVIRDFRETFRAIRIWGARVITSDPDYIYVPVRRLLIFIEKSIDVGLQWVVFEPNDEALWARVRFAIESFLTTVWRNGALEGTTTAQAFFVICDRTTMTQDDIDNGRLICLIGVAPVKPAEFVIIRIGLMTASATT
jgi:phage tail sheath protein FI